jgi:hypothetical protein
MSMTAKLQDKDGVKVLHVEIPLQNPTPSAAGKTLVVATSHGNMPTTIIIDGKPVIIGLNAYIRK